MSSNYITRADIENEVGIDNVFVWADLDNTQDAVKIAARIQRAIDVASDYVDDRLRTSVYAVPLTSVGGTLYSFNSIVARFAASWLYGSRGLRDGDKTADRVKAFREDAQTELEELLSGKIHIAAVRRTVGGVEIPRVGGGVRFPFSVLRGEGFNGWPAGVPSADGQNAGAFSASWT